MKKIICFIMVAFNFVFYSPGQISPLESFIPDRASVCFYSDWNKGFERRPSQSGFSVIVDSYNPDSYIFNWDTIVTYDIQGLLGRHSQTCDVNGKILFRLEEKRQTNTWTNSLAYSFTYDDNGNCLTQLSQEWQSNAWVNSRLWTYTYDVNGNMLTFISESWANNAWVNGLLRTYTYDGNGNMLTGTVEIWENNVWINSSRWTYTYDGNNNLMTGLIEAWQNNAWVNILLGTFTYDGNGNMLTELDKQWQNNAWVNSGRFTYTYDGNGNVLTLTSETWQNNTWVYQARDTNTYDGGGNMLEKLHEIWQGAAWLNDSKRTYSYDANGNSVSGTYEKWSSGVWNPGKSNLEIYTQKQSVYSLISLFRYEAVFNGYTIGYDDGSQDHSALVISPNPAHDNITFEPPKTMSDFPCSLTIFGTDGRQMISQHIARFPVIISITSLPVGFYLLCVSCYDEVYSGKFIKK